MRAFILGIVQGLTEFLPVSSSGHLALIGKYFLPQENTISFFVLLHVATLFSLICFFHRDIKDYLRDRRILTYIIVATVTTAVGAFILRGRIEPLFANTYIIAFSYVLTASVLFFSRINTGNDKKLSELTLKDSFIVGAIQIIALLPGVSRSAITIVTLLKRGFKPLEAFKFSFLMAIPLIAGTFLFECGKLASSSLPTGFLLIGFISAFISGLCALIWLKAFVVRKKFYIFGYYCLVLSVISIVVSR